MTTNEEHVCGTCRWHRYERIDRGWICVNADSDYCAGWTEYGDTCEHYEEKD